MQGASSRVLLLCGVTIGGRPKVVVGSSECFGGVGAVRRGQRAQLIMPWGRQGGMRAQGGKRAYRHLTDQDDRPTLTSTSEQRGVGRPSG